MNIKFACWSIAAGLALISATCVAAGKGEMWEITAKMEMEGMPFAMPAQTSKACIPKGQEKDPTRAVPNDKNCKTSDVKVSGNKMSWKMKCEGKDAMSGSGEMVYGDGTYSGKVKMHSEDGDMVMAYNGKRVGSCDAGVGVGAEMAVEKKRMVETIQAPIKEERRANCKELLDKGGEALINGYAMFVYPGTVCADMKKSMCDKVRAQSPEIAVYEALVQGEKPAAMMRKEKEAQEVQAFYDTTMDSEKSAAMMRKEKGAQALKPLVAACGFDMAKVTGVVCQKAKGDKNYGFLAANCPGEAQELAKRCDEVMGRSYSSEEGSQFAPICAKYAKNKKSRYPVWHDDASADSSGEKEGVIGKLFGGKSEEPPAADKQKPQDGKTGEKTDNPAGAVLDGAKKLKGLFGF